jgi:hypothetical protein
VQKYVQFGDVFNLLHGAASYIRVHQKGFGAVGVSKKYGKRSWARYPIFWGLSNIGNLPNPDPSDTAAWSNEQGNTSSKVIIDEKLNRIVRNLREKPKNGLVWPRSRTLSSWYSWGDGRCRRGLILLLTSCLAYYGTTKMSN